MIHQFSRRMGYKRWPGTTKFVLRVNILFSFIYYTEMFFFSFLKEQSRKKIDIVESEKIMYKLCLL